MKQTSTAGCAAAGQSAGEKVDRHLSENETASEALSRDKNRVPDGRATFGERLANRIVTAGGSWTFIICFAAVLCGWIALNTFVLMMRGAAFDPYPYILLNLTLSTVAAFQAPIIMMSQNRQGTKDRLDATHAYAINLNLEVQITTLHEKVDGLRGEQQAELGALQEQLRLLLKPVNNSASIPHRS